MQILRRVWTMGWLGTAAVLWVLLHAGAAAGQSSSDTTIAEALFQDARKLLKAGKAVEACPKFEESYRLVPKLGTLLNLATCHAQEGKTGSAWGEFTKAASLAHGAGNKNRETYAREQLAELDGRLSKISVEVAHEVEGIEVLIDGAAISKAAWKTPLPLDPGEHEVEVRAPGHAAWRDVIDVPDGPGTLTVEIPELALAEGAAPEPEPDGPGPDQGGDDGSGQRIAGWVLGAAGLVALGVGTGFGIDTFVKQGDSDDHCEGTLCDQEGVDLREGASTSATISTITFIGGGVLVVTGLIVLLTAPDGDETEEVARRWQIAPVLGPTGAGLGLVGTW